MTSQATCKLMVTAAVLVMMSWAQEERNCKKHNETCTTLWDCCFRYACGPTSDGTRQVCMPALMKRCGKDGEECSRHGDCCIEHHCQSYYDFPTKLCERTQKEKQTDYTENNRPI